MNPRFWLANNWLRTSIIIILLIRSFYIGFLNAPDPIIFGSGQVFITGYIDDYKEERISTDRYRIKITEFNGVTVTEKSRLLVVVSPYEKDLEYGTYVNLTGTIENPKDFITDTGKSFDYDSYLALSNIYGIMRDPEIEIMDKKGGNSLMKTLFSIRKKFSTTLNNLLNEDSAILSRGVLLGEKSGITNDLRNNLAKTSTSHIIALSGYNITIVSEIIMQVTQGLSMVLRTVLGASGILLFVMLAGGGSSAIRAMIMAFILLYARNRGKSYNALWALTIAFTILTTISPRALRYDQGLHLSFLATFGLIVFQTYFASFFIRKHFVKWLANALASTISASIMTLPYIAYKMGIISITGILANVLIVPLLPFLMLFSFLTGIIGFMGNTVVIPFAYITNTISSFILFVINYLGELPFSAIYKEHISIIWILLVYGVILYFAVGAQKITNNTSSPTLLQ